MNARQVAATGPNSHERMPASGGVALNIENATVVPLRPPDGVSLETAVRVHIAGLAPPEAERALDRGERDARDVLRAAGALLTWARRVGPDAAGWVTVEAWGYR